MKEKTEKHFTEEHKQEIQALNSTIDEVTSKLTQLRKEYPNVGFMLYFGIADPEYHWTCRHIDINKQLAAEIIRDELQNEEDIREWVLEYIFETCSIVKSEKVKK